MKILNIKKLQSGKYKITFDNNEKLTLHDDIILKNNLLFHKEITNEEFNELNKENNNYNNYAKVLKYISYKMRSTKEVKEYLKKLKCSEFEQSEIIEKLINNKLINDELYVKSFINDKINLSLDGPYKIRRYLESQDIDSSFIDKELDKIDYEIFENKLKKIIEKKIKTNHKDSEYQLKKKILEYCSNIGYPKDMINENLCDVKIDSSKIIQKEYNLLYQKLDTKYDDNSIKYEIKKRLLNKGFKIEQINDVIENSE